MNVFRSLSYPILLALLAVYFAWGGTYLAMRIAVETMPPFLLAGIRFLTAGLLLYLWEMLKGTGNAHKVPLAQRCPQWRHDAVRRQCLGRLGRTNGFLRHCLSHCRYRALMDDLIRLAVVRRG